MYRAGGPEKKEGPEAEARAGIARSRKRVLGENQGRRENSAVEHDREVRRLPLSSWTSGLLTYNSENLGKSRRCRETVVGYHNPKTSERKSKEVKGTEIEEMKRNKFGKRLSPVR